MRTHFGIRRQTQLHGSSEIPSEPLSSMSDMTPSQREQRLSSLLPTPPVRPVATSLRRRQESPRSSTALRAAHTASGHLSNAGHIQRESRGSTRRVRARVGRGRREKRPDGSFGFF